MHSVMAGLRGYIWFSLLAVLCASSPSAAQSRTAPNVENTQPDVKTVVVVGKRRNLTIVQATPRLSLKAADVQAYGADSLSELLDLIKPQTRSVGGNPPIVLLNGHRVSGFSVLSALPPEAVARIDTFSEATAQGYGYPSGQMVVNIVLAADYLGRILTASQDGAFRDHGGTTKLKYSHLHIGETGRASLALNYENTNGLMESDRGVVTATTRTPFDVTGNITSNINGREIDPTLSALAGTPVTVLGLALAPTDLSDFLPYANLLRQTNLSAWRSLVPASEKFDATVSVNRTLFDSVDATVDASITGTRKKGFQGLASGSLLLPASNPFSVFSESVLIDRYFAEVGALQQASDNWTSHAGLSLDGALRSWQWNAIARADHIVDRARNETGIDLSGIQSALNSGSPSVNPFLPFSIATQKLVSSQNQVSDQYMAQVMISGPLIQLPTGPLNLSANIGANGARVAVQTEDDTGAQVATIDQDVLTTQVGLFLPISTKDKSLLPGLRDLNLIANITTNQTSGFSASHGFSYMLMWLPLNGISINLNKSRMQMAPGASALATNAIETPNIIVFDYVRGENAIVTQVTGSNPDLPTARIDSTGIDLYVMPWPKVEFSLSTGLNRMQMSGAAGELPPATREAELAFPDRYTRDADGRLIRIDARSVGYARQQTDQIRTSVDYKCATGTCDWIKVFHWPGSRLSLSITHTLRLQDRVLIRKELPEINRLKGGIAGGAGQPKSLVEWEIGLTSPTCGFWFSGKWQDGALALGGTPESNLTFSNVTVANLRFFVNLGKLNQTASAAWAKGLRATLSIDNLLDDYQRARDENGNTPLLYQRGIIDPMGRTTTLSLRKAF
jgi:iron complex outermembrane receptor protein